MTEVLFVLGVIFVAYVISSRGNVVPAANAPQQPGQIPIKPSVIHPVPAIITKANITAPTASKPTPVKTLSTKTKPKTTTDKPVKTVRIKKAALKTPSDNLGKISLKNPLTGDIAAPYSNYRFTKRWLKDALVTEGLLEKVYKNTELDAAIEAKIKAAVTELEAMDSYRV